MDKETLKAVMSHLGKESHRKSPRKEGYYKELAKKRWDKHRDKFSTTSAQPVEIPTNSPEYRLT